MFYSINEGIDALKSKHLKELKNFEPYLSLEAKNLQGHIHGLEAIVDAFLLGVEKTPQLLLIEGVAGSGKTQFCQKLTINLWWQYNKDEMIIPVYIPLVNLINPKLKAVEETLESIGFSQEQIIILKKSRNFVFILDGYDEIYELINLHLTNKISEWRAKTIITCRSESLYFISDYTKYFVPFKENKRLTYGLQQIVIQPLSEIQVLSNSSVEYDVVNDRKLLSLIQTPLLLKSMPFIENNFYNSLIEARLLWQEQKKLKPKKDYFWNYCKKIALTMQQQKTNTIQYIKTNSLFEEDSKTNVWGRFFTNDPEIQALYAACPLIKIGNHIKFIDDELINYFASKPIKECNLFKEASAAGYDEGDVETEPALPVIGRISFTMQTGKIQQLADRIKESTDFKESLFKYIGLSKTDKKYSIAAANAITGLNAAKVYFSSMDFTGVNIANAVLSQGVFDNTNFSNSNLTNVNFQRSWIANTNFTNAIMKDIFFGELAYLDLDKKVKSICYSQSIQQQITKKQYLAVAVVSIVVLYDAKTLQEIKLLKGHEDTVRALSFSCFDEYLASGSDDKFIRIWDINTGECIQIFKGHNKVVSSVAFCPMYNYLLASGSDDKTIRIWNLQTNICEKIFYGHTHYVLSICFSLDGKYLFSGSRDNTIRMWEMSTNNCERIFNEHIDNVSSLSIHPSDNYLASASYDQTIRLWNIETGKCQRIFKGHKKNILSICFSPTGEYLASSGNDMKIFLWNMQSGECQKIFEGHTDIVQSLSFNYDGSYLASGSDSETVRFWNMSLGAEPEKFFEGHADCIYSLSFNYNGEILASGSHDFTIRLWIIQTGECKKILKGHTNKINSIHFNPVNDCLASGSDDKTVKLWNIEGNAKKTFKEHIESITCVTFSPCGGYLASSSDDGIIYLRNLQDWSCKRIIQHTSIKCIAFSPSGEYIAIGCKTNTISLWNIKKDICENFPSGNTEDIISNLIFIDKGKHLISANYHNKNIRLWSIEKKECQQILYGYDREIVSIAINKSEEYLASGGWDKTIKIWQIIKKNSLNIASTYKFLNKYFYIDNFVSNYGNASSILDIMYEIVGSKETGEDARRKVAQQLKENLEDIIIKNLIYSEIHSTVCNYEELLYIKNLGFNLNSDEEAIIEKFILNELTRNKLEVNTLELQQLIEKKTLNYIDQVISNPNYFFKLCSKCNGIIEAIAKINSINFIVFYKTDHIEKETNAIEIEEIRKYEAKIDKPIYYILLHTIFNGNGVVRNSWNFELLKESNIENIPKFNKNNTLSIGKCVSIKPINVNIFSLIWQTDVDKGDFLAVAGSDAIVRLWYFDKLNYSLTFVWSNIQKTLQTIGSKIINTKELSIENKDLLIQRGAIVGSSIQNIIYQNDFKEQFTLLKQYIISLQHKKSLSKLNSISQSQQKSQNEKEFIEILKYSQIQSWGKKEINSVVKNIYSSNIENVKKTMFFIKKLSSILQKKIAYTCLLNEIKVNNHLYTTQTLQIAYIIKKDLQEQTIDEFIFNDIKHELPKIIQIIVNGEICFSIENNSKHRLFRSFRDSSKIFCEQGENIETESLWILKNETIDFYSENMCFSLQNIYSKDKLFQAHPDRAKCWDEDKSKVYCNNNKNEGNTGLWEIEIIPTYEINSETNEMCFMFKNKFTGDNLAFNGNKVFADSIENVEVKKNFLWLLKPQTTL